MPEITVSREDIRKFNSAAKEIIAKYITTADLPVFEAVRPSRYPELIRQTWYSLFDPSKSGQYKQENRELIKEILALYGSSDPATLLRCTEPRYKLPITNVTISQLLSCIELRKQVVVPIMTGGIIPAAFVCSYLKRRGFLEDMSFVGIYRNKTTEPDYYEPGKVYATEQDLEILRKNAKNPILLVDDAIEEGKTAIKVVGFLSDLGIPLENIHMVVIKDYGFSTRFKRS